MIVVVAAVLLAQGCRARPKTLDDWGRFPIRASLGPYDSATGTLPLVVENISRRPVFVSKLSLLQVGRVSTHFTTAYESGADAKHVNWLIWPGGHRQFVFDLDQVEFSSLADGRRAIARKFVEEIDETDRELSVSVATGNVQVIARHSNPH